LSAIYAALEPALRRHAAHPVLAAVYSTELFRGAALTADIRALRNDCAIDSDGDQPIVALAAATLSYVARLRELDTSKPELLLAHAYVRYLGDLNGGQILKAIVGKSLALSDVAATSFYDFGDAARIAEMARQFRAGLAGLSLMPPAADAIVNEAKRSFELHIAMFDELSAQAFTCLPAAATMRAAPVT
jgi:heme oxygenase